MKTIGGSDIGAILGLSPWVTPLQAWRRIMGIDPPSSDNPSMAEGRAMEPVILAEYAEDTGATLERQVCGRSGWARWSIDAIATLPDGSRRIVEAKWSSRGMPEVPAHYWAQVTWYMAHTGIQSADLAVREPGKRTRSIPITWDQEAADEMMSAVARWYDRHVARDIPPEPTGPDERCSAALERIRPGGPVLMPEEALDRAILAMLDERDRIKAAESRIKAAEAALLEAMAGCGALKATSASGWTATVVERGGTPRWREIAGALGAAERPDIVARYTSAPSRYLRLVRSSKGGQDE